MEIQPDSSPTRAAQRDARRAQILAVGLELFVRRGYSATRVADIADAAQMSTGLLFHYFPSKKDLYEELVRTGLARSTATVSMADASDALAYFDGVATTVIGGMRASRFVARMFVLISRADADAVLGEDVVSRATLDALDRSATIIRSGQEAGTVRRGDPLALATAFWGALQGAAQLVALSENIPCPEPAWIVDLLRPVVPRDDERSDS
ncbi:MAG TPA: helix-turn-helix domain-containing protein [Arachnia sp.]|nr:helix-turn-helix domain-containing protein [Arachnia sp.]HMT85404.1 helix-turn-helix domain-containing protein [Arachnia sp.]